MCVFGINSAIEQILIFLKNEVQAETLTDLRKPVYRERLLEILTECPLGLYHLGTWQEVFRWLDWSLSFSDYQQLKSVLESARIKDVNEA